MAQPVGLHGWIQSNDGRSTALFLAFLLAVQLIAPLALVGPLILVDPDHTPFLGWNGYLLRYAPLVLVASVGWFATQLWWHVETVKRAVGFHFVDDADEPRLCRIVEPLIILAGLAAPFMGVVESDARNAFACGIARKKAVVVVTRGLLDALDDAELRAVLAHELSHIRNGDIRLMAAANILMSALTRLNGRNMLRFSPVHGVLALFLPALLPLSLAGSLIGRWALKAGQVSRLLIASSREFIADAQAVQWTKDPAALASALLKVDERHRVEGARDEDDAMMIAGETSGPDATHPLVAQRIAALARVTGSMVFNAPHAPRDDDWTPATPRSAVETMRFGRRAAAVVAFTRVRHGDENVLGLTPWGTLALVLTVGALAGLHWDELGNRRALAARFDLSPVTRVVSSPVMCGISPIVRWYRPQCGARLPELLPFSRPRPDAVTDRADGRLQPYDRPRVLVQPEGAARPATTFTGCDPDRVARRLDFGGTPAADLDGGGELALVCHRLGDLARQTVESPGEASMVASYLDRRSALLDDAYAADGRDGLQAVAPALASPEQMAALDHVMQAANAPGVLSGLTPAQQAKYRLLVREPLATAPCGD